MAAAASTRTESKSPFSETELVELKSHFSTFDTNGDGKIDTTELTLVLKQLKLYNSPKQVEDLIREVDKDGNGTIEYAEFLDIVNHIKTGRASAATGFAHVYTKQKELIQVKGAAGVHSYSEEEMAAFSEHFNNCLSGDADVKHLLPIDEKGMDLCRKVKDGLILAKFINLCVKDTIDIRAVNLPKATKPLSTFQMQENINLAIASAKAIGVQTVGQGALELMDGERFPHLVLGIVWQLVKIHLLNSINLKSHPELIRLLEEGETLQDLLRLPPDLLLMRWFNYHLKKANSTKRVRNFGGDVKDSEAYTILLNQIAPGKCDRSALTLSDQTARATKVLQNAKNLEVKSFIKPRDIVAGNPRLNLVFTAAIFNQCPGLDPLTQDEIDKAGLMDDDFGDSREERAFRMWINSLSIDGVYVNNLYEDCSDGLVLLKVIDKVKPGIVDWSPRCVEKVPNNKFKKVSNCNYVIVLGRQLKFSLVGIGGSDIQAGNKKLLLAFVWQLMRFHVLRFLAEVQAKKFGGGEVTDQMLIDLVNKRVADSGQSSRMASFRDPTLSTGIFFLDLLRAVEPRIINPEYVTAGDTKENQLLNAKYAISVARKLGAVVFLLPEDIQEVKPKMILTFVASVLSVDKAK
jgi:plastin-1